MGIHMRAQRGAFTVLGATTASYGRSESKDSERLTPLATISPFGQFSYTSVFP